MKIIAITSSIDLREPPAGTLVWWQLFKALYEINFDLIVVPFIGDEIESPWWRCFSNPALKTSKLIYRTAEKVSPFKFANLSYKRNSRSVVKSLRSILLPRWRKTIDHILSRNKQIEALVFCTVPANLLQSLPTHVKKKWGIPSIFYDIDMPDVLPEYGGFHFSYYVDADLSEYSGFLSNSEGVRKDLEKMGAAKIFTLHFATDPGIYSPIEEEKNMDIFFSGVGRKFRERWIDKMLINPSLSDERLTFAASGRQLAFKQGHIKHLGYLPFGEWRKQCCKSKINLNVSREPHARTYGTSTYRIFELCSLGCCVVSNPHLGLDNWFEIGKEIYVVEPDENPIEIYHHLLQDSETIRKIGSAARVRTLKEHTYRHRAEQLKRILKRIV